MGEDDGRAEAVRASPLDEALVVDAAGGWRFFENRFEPAGGAGNVPNSGTHSTSI